MARYAESTQVSADRSRAEIERTLMRYGATGFAYGWQGERAMVQFDMARRRIRFELPLPDRNSDEFTLTPTGRERGAKQAMDAWEQACRQRWRALSLAIKAKLEAVECGITDFESEFLAHIVLPGGGTVGPWLLPQIADDYKRLDVYCADCGEQVTECRAGENRFKDIPPEGRTDEADAAWNTAGAYAEGLRQELAHARADIERLSVDLAEAQREIERQRFSVEWNRSRLDRLQKEQARIPDPWRTLVCDILANGSLLPDPEGTRYGP